MAKVIVGKNRIDGRTTPNDGYRALAITTGVNLDVLSANEGEIKLRSRNDTTSTDAIPVL